ncbi:MAG TPA: TadE family protein [Stellaceae bacterium]|nr:TadE family protein [Stellaceae bacterium]
MTSVRAFFAAFSRPFRPLAADKGGATAVQFALIATPLFLFLFGIEETARIMWTQSAINMAVEDAARYSSVSGPTGACTAAATVQTYAASRAWGLSLPSGDFTASAPACGCQVTASVPFTPIVPNLVPYNITLTASACFPQWS